MAKHCETFDHTADVGLAATGDTLGELFEALAEGLAELICPVGQVAAAQVRLVTVRADDLEALAVDFLTRVLVMILAERFPVAQVRVKRIDENIVEAEIVGEPLDAARHEFHTEVKAVTYHQLSIASADGLWRGRVILDI